MNRKVIVLGLALIMPVIAFLVLKFFGKNEFEVPPLFQAPDDALSADCQIQFPYAVDESSRRMILDSPEDEFVVIASIDSQEYREVVAQMERAAGEFAADRVGYVMLMSNPDVNRDGIHSKVMSSSRITELRKCVLLMTERMDAVVLDREGRIRGQYDLDDLDDADRLILELKILLRKY